MSFHTNRNDVIETGDDIQDVLGVHVSEENGQKVATIKAILDPRKEFLAIKDFFVHLTNGINHRLLGPFSSVDTPADLPSVPAPAPVVPEPVATPQASEAGTEATQPLSEAPASTETGETHAEPGDTTPQGEATTATTPDDSAASEDTVKVPTSDVIAGNKKGN